MGKYSDFPSQTPQVKPNSAIYTPKHPRYFYMGVTPSPTPVVKRPNSGTINQ